jgi:hypothetical protein
MKYIGKNANGFNQVSQSALAVTVNGIDQAIYTTSSYTYSGNTILSGSLIITNTLISPPPATPSIGDSLQGGKVAYILTSSDIGYDSNYIKGIIAAGADLTGYYSWDASGNYPYILATGSAIGTGQGNTTKIVDFLGSNGEAAYACDQDTEGGYSDWYLPSRNELQQLYNNRNLIGGFQLEFYWSSTQVDNYSAVAISFEFGYTGSEDKMDGLRVRPIRSFSIPKFNTNRIIVTGSIESSNGITGSLLGTSSWATNAVTASYANNFTVANTLTSRNINSNGLIISNNYGDTQPFLLNGSDVYGENYFYFNDDGSTNAGLWVESLSEEYAASRINLRQSYGEYDYKVTIDPYSLIFTDSRTGIETRLFASGVPSALLFPNTSGITRIIPTSVNGAFPDPSGSITFTSIPNALTASYANNFTVAGTLTAQTIVVQTITSSVDYVTGSTRFGSLLSNTHRFTGSVSITGSLNVAGSGITGSLFGTSSYAVTASYLTGSIFTGTNTARSASYALTASYALNGGGGTTNTGSLLTTASVSLNTITFTKGDGSTFPITVNTGSGGGGGGTGNGFPFTGDALITGSLLISGSGLTIIGPDNGKLINITNPSKTTANFYFSDDPADGGLVIDDPNREYRSRIVLRNTFDSSDYRVTITPNNLQFSDNKFGKTNYLIPYYTHNSYLGFPNTSGIQRLIPTNVNGIYADISGSITVDTFPFSTKFGAAITNTHQFTGSVLISGSSTIRGNTTLSGSITIAPIGAPLNFNNASATYLTFASGSYLKGVINAVTGAASASIVISSSLIPATTFGASGAGSKTSSFSLGSIDHKWDSVWVKSVNLLNQTLAIYDKDDNLLNTLKADNLVPKDPQHPEYGYFALLNSTAGASNEGDFTNYRTPYDLAVNKHQSATDRYVRAGFGFQSKYHSTQLGDVDAAYRGGIGISLNSAFRAASQTIPFYYTTSSGGEIESRTSSRPDIAYGFDILGSSTVFETDITQQWAPAFSTTSSITILTSSLEDVLTSVPTLKLNPVIDLTSSLQPVLFLMGDDTYVTEKEPAAIIAFAGTSSFSGTIPPSGTVNFNYLNGVPGEYANYITYYFKTGSNTTEALQNLVSTINYVANSSYLKITSSISASSLYLQSKISSSNANYFFAYTPSFGTYPSYFSGGTTYVPGQLYPAEGILWNDVTSSGLYKYGMGLRVLAYGADGEKYYPYTEIGDFNYIGNKTRILVDDKYSLIHLSASNINIGLLDAGTINIDARYTTIGSATSRANNRFYGDLSGTASYADNGGVTQIIAGTYMSLSPSNGKGVVTINSTIGGIVNNNGGANVTSSFTSSSVWTFDHALGVKGVVVQVYDTNWSQLIPQSITLTNTNTATITFPAPQSGYAIASVGGFATNLSGSLIPQGPVNSYQFKVDSATFSGSNALRYISDTAGISATGSFTGSFSGSLFGTSSYALNTLTASYALNAANLPSDVILSSQTSSMTVLESSKPFASNGNNIWSTNPLATSSLPGNYNLAIGSGAGSGMNGSWNTFIGQNVAGDMAGSSLTGLIAIGGRFTAYRSINSSYSTIIGYQAGYASTSSLSVGRNNIIIGTSVTLEAGRRDSINLGGIIFATGSYYNIGFISSGSVGNGRVGINVVFPNYNFDVSGSGNYSNGLTVTGSLIADTITGSLQGTSSWASNSISSSYALTASYAMNAGGGTGAGFPYSGSAVITGSLLVSGSGLTVTGSLNISGSITGSNALFTGTITAQTLVVQTITSSVEWVTGSSKFGNVITDTHQFTGSVSISGSLNATSSWAVSSSQAISSSYALTASYALTSAGTITNASTASFVTSSGVYGPNGANSILSSSYALTASYAMNGGGGSGGTSNTTSPTVAGVNTLFTQATSSYNSAFSNYTVLSGSNARAGQFITIWNSGSVTYTDISTTDIGSTSNVTFSSSFSGSNIQIQASASAGWTIKTLTNFI